MPLTNIPTQGSASWYGWAKDIHNQVAASEVEIDLKTSDRAHRILVGGNVEGVGDGANVGTRRFDPTRTLEGQMGAKFDIVNTYQPCNPDSAAHVTSDLVPELNRDPNRRILWVFETWRSNSAFINEFDTKTGIYPNLLATLTAIRDSGHMDRIFLAPFHEGNGSGGTYPWQMYDTGRGNSPALYVQAFRRVVTLARELGLTSKFIQWWLVSNTSSAADNQDFASGFAGDDYVDIIGVSYYNRSKAIGYGDTWTPVGADLRTWYRRMERLSARNMWICETGCAASHSGHDKGLWYAGVIGLAASDELPRMEAVCMFLKNATSTNMSLENTEQRRRVGRAINAARRQGRATEPGHFAVNMLPPDVASPTRNSAWTFTGTGITSELLAPQSLGGRVRTMRVTKPASAGGGTGSDYAFYRTIQSGFTDYVVGQPYVLTFRARAIRDGFVLSAGIREPGGNAIFSGDTNIPLTVAWETYVVQVGTATLDSGSWRMPYFRFGFNADAGWVEVADLRLSHGTMPSPAAEKAFVPKVRDAADASTIQWDCEYGDIWKVTLGGNRTLAVPSGAPYDGQEISLRAVQDNTGNRTITLASGFRSSSVPLVLSTAGWRTDLLTFQYDERQDKWGLVRCVNWGT